MKKLLMAMTAIGALAAAAPAAGQGYDNDRYDDRRYDNQRGWNAGGSAGIENRIAQLDARLQAGISAGLIDRAEARDLRMQLRDLRRLERQYSVNGLTQVERQDLQARLREARQDLRLADNGRYDRDSRYSWNDDDRYDGRGGPYEEVCETRGGVLGGLVDTVLGTRDDCGLAIGQRATGNLYSVPYEYRGRYRDGRGVYYRSDGRQIYQIDARTNTVLRVYGMNR